MKYLLIILFLLPLAASSQLITDTVIYISNSGDTIKTVTFRNAGTTTTATPTRLNDSMAVMRGLIALKQNLLGFIAVPNTLTVNSKALSGNISITASDVGLGNVTNESKATMFTSPTFTGTTTGITKSMVGLGNVDNTSDASKPISTATQTALDLKLATNGNGSSLTNLTKTQVGLANVDNTSDASKPVSTATQTALNLKQDALVSATNIKTVNGNTLLGSGDVSIAANVSTFVRVTGSNATTTGQSLVDITGLSQALLANSIYEFEAVLETSTTAVTTGIGYGVNYSAAGASIESQITGSSTATATKTLRINAFNTAATAFLTGSAQTGGILIKGVIATGANAGNLTIMHRKETSGTSTVFINSFLKVTKL